MQPLVVEPARVLWHRLRANQLAARLPPGSYAEAAYAGLQDSAPRAALTALHARIDDVWQTDWEHPSLVQTWAPRGAVFVVPRDDLAIFALGILPRDPAVAAAVEQLSRRARDTLPEPRYKTEAETSVDPIPPIVAEHLRRRPIWRLVHAIAGVLVRWDASSTLMLPGPAPQADPEDARRELARRFLRSLGPATPARFARWAAVTPADAATTFGALADELVEVRWQGGSGAVLAADCERLAGAEPVAGIRLLSFGGDPVLQPGEDVVSPGIARAALPPWACTGLALCDGRIVAAWGRSSGRITLLALTQLGREHSRAIERAAARLPGIEDAGWREP